MTARPEAPTSGGPVLPAEAVAELRHELRTPVNVITGYAEMLLEDAVGDATDPALAAPLEQLGGEMREVLRLIAAALPPSADAVAWETVWELRTRLLERQARVEALLAAASASPSAARPEVADDLRRMTTAAGRLAAIEAHGAAEMAAVAVERVAELVVPRPDAVAPAYLLVVDDLEDNRAVLSRRLERLGHRVACAADGHAALAMAAAEAFDVILLDVMMPGLDGFATLVALKGDAATRDVPVIMISALDDLGSTARCIAQGAEDYLPKPFEPLLLQARVGASLERKRLRDRERDFLTQTTRVIDAARAVEEGRYDSEAMAEIAARGDELGRLARVFDGMAAEVRARETRLQRQLGDLQREIDAARGIVTQDGAPDAASAASPAAEPSSPLLEGSAAHTLHVGQRLAGRYEIFAVVGQGGMGRVYRATDRELGAEVAIKVLRPDVLDDDPSLRDAIKSEILLSRRITHPNVVRTHDFGEADGLAFITMEYVAGVSLRGMLESRGQLAPGATIALGLQLLRALHAAHEVGVVHRDIKPDNVLLSTTGVLKVMDFGIARLLETAGGSGAGDGSGTLGYMAPEQLMEEPVDARADLYASGVLLYECLTGRLPFEASNPFALMGQLMRGVVPDACAHAPDVSPALSSLIASLLRVEPGDRPATARQVEVALEGMR